MFFNNYLFTLPDGKKGIGFKIPSIQVFNFIFILVFICPSVRRPAESREIFFLFEILLCKSS
ncbi:MAG TPA: hypothetical protein DHW82_03860 [Spirochaetia bacterium]|nr:hypothetical protein [Spirochaetia bacterium]